VNSAHVQKRFQTITTAYFDWFTSTSWVARIGLSFAMAFVTGIAAQVRIPLWFTPVPVTAQVFTVLLAGVLLGSLHGGMSMLLYLILGYAGIPWFTNAATGLPLGPTSGYLIGFIPAAFIIGYLLRLRYTHNIVTLILIMISAVGIIYLFGAIHFALFMKTGITTTLVMAVLPFIPFDIAKALLAAVCARAVMPPAYSKSCR
jgi:biotin transport system substrate-specific component